MPIDDLRQSLTCPKPHRTLCNIADTKIVCTKGFMGLVDMYCKLQSITFSHNKTNLDPSESLFFPAKPAGVHKKPISILMQLICATFRPLFLENICSRLLRNQMIVMLISVLERVRTRTQWVSPSPDSSPDSDSTLVDSDLDSVDSDSSAVHSDSGLKDSDSDSTQVDSDSQWVQVSPVRNVGLQDNFKLSCAIMDKIRGRNKLNY